MDRRWTAVAVAAGGALLLIVGMLTGRWLVGSVMGADIRVGLLSGQICTEGDCAGASFASLGANASMRWAGLVVVALGSLAALSLGISLALAAMQRDVTWSIAPESLAIVTTGLSLVAAVITLVYFQSGMRGLQLGTGFSFVVFGLGSALGLFAAILLGRLPRADNLQFEPPFDPL